MNAKAKSWKKGVPAFFVSRQFLLPQEETKTRVARLAISEAQARGKKVDNHEFNDNFRKRPFLDLQDIIRTQTSAELLEGINSHIIR